LRMDAEAGGAGKGLKPEEEWKGRTEEEAEECEEL
jgi:hypothetical protein